MDLDVLNEAKNTPCNLLNNRILLQLLGICEPGLAALSVLYDAFAKQQSEKFKYSLVKRLETVENKIAVLEKAKMNNGCSKRIFKCYVECTEAEIIL